METITFRYLRVANSAFIELTIVRGEDALEIVNRPVFMKRPASNLSFTFTGVIFKTKFYLLLYLPFRA